LRINYRPIIQFRNVILKLYKSSIPSFILLKEEKVIKINVDLKIGTNTKIAETERFDRLNYRRENQA